MLRSPELKSNKTLETMDEEKAYEVQVGEDDLHANFTAPHMVRRGLTEVSSMFDREGKGYLDDTERALRRMDSTNQGYLGVDKVCIIFESLQAEQERSSKLLEALQEENKKTLNLKKGVIALSVFAFLLALANIGTSFAVSMLVKDMETSSRGDLVVLASGQRVGTTSKLVSVMMQPVSEERRRRLQDDENFVCEQEETIQDENGEWTKKQCTLAGLVRPAEALALYQQFRPCYPDGDCSGDVAGVDKVELICNNKESEIKGGMALPAVLPGVAEGLGMLAYPSQDPNKKYQGTQLIGDDMFGNPCYGDFGLSMYCFEDEDQECLVIVHSNTTPQCGAEPEICGPIAVSDS